MMGSASARSQTSGSFPAVLALLYDIHGNLGALEAVLADASEADRFLVGGDIAGFGAWPAETVERLRGLDAEWIRGNVDRWLTDRSDAPEAMHPLLDATVDVLGEGVSAELASLPETTTRDGVLYCHASPLSDMESFLPEPGDRDAELLMGTEARRVVFGHTHLAFRREGPAGIELVNPGSVGIPLDGDRRSAYGLVADDGGIEQRRVEYDSASSAAELRARFGAAGEIPARRIEQARFDVT
jgi:diadenosine tetraphosphatase ApaH/serine/threonine PP2A family protein phosphatase